MWKVWPQKKSNKLCPNYKPRKPRKARAQQIPRADNLNPAATESVPPAAQEITGPTNEVDQSTQETTGTATNVSTINRGDKFTPTFIKVGEKKSYTLVVDVGSRNFKPSPTIFKLLGIAQNNPATAEEMMNLSFSLTFVCTMVHSSNAYRAERKRLYPNLTVWKTPKVSAPFTVLCNYHFLAFTYYFGIVQLPSKANYWNQDEYAPSHPIACEMGMTRDCFKFLWWHFHVSHPTSDDFEGTALEDDDDEEELLT